MTAERPSIYEFGSFRLEAVKRLLLRNGTPVPLTPKAFDTLLHLVRHQGKVVAKNELMRVIWPDTVVEENNLNQNISTLRRVLGETRGDNLYIATIPGKGYQFIPTVEVIAGSEPDASLPVTLAVLPFENLSAQPERDYVADGLTEELIASLGLIDPEHLCVIGRTTMMAYKRTPKTLAQIADELQAAYIIESSMRTEGQRLRITSKLIRVRDQAQLWSMSYDSQPGSLLEFQQEISRTIGEQVRLRLSPERLTALARRHSRNAEAYDLYLRGRHFWNQLSPATTKRASAFFLRATQLDPQYALAWSGLADTYTASPINGDAPPLEVGPLARDAAAHAIAADPTLADAQTSLGFVKFWIDWEWPAAESAFRKAIALDPNYSLAHRLLGIVLSHLGRSDEALAAIGRARQLDALLAGHYALSAQIAFSGRDFTAAERFARQSTTIDPEFWIGHMQLGQALEQLGKGELALDALNLAARLSCGNSKAISLRGYILAKMGRTQEAQEVLRMLETLSNERFVPPVAQALVYAGLREHTHALLALERALQVRDVHLAFLPVDPKWDPFREDTRFRSLLKACGFAGS
ncbi:MAG: winged helix-turn-helix domain-containing protein [Candidatus Acidiferrum sp.]|jgi:TolB-like protein/Flp pilus assembly protein TadD